MNIHGHKEHAKYAAEQEKYWAGQEREQGAHARKKAKQFEGQKKWHLSMVAELKGRQAVVQKKTGEDKNAK